MQTTIQKILLGVIYKRSPLLRLQRLRQLRAVALEEKAGDNNAEEDKGRVQEETWRLNCTINPPPSAVPGVNLHKMIHLSEIRLLGDLLTGLLWLTFEDVVESHRSSGSKRFCKGDKEDVGYFCLVPVQMNVGVLTSRGGRGHWRRGHCGHPKVGQRHVDCSKSCTLVAGLDERDAVRRLSLALAAAVAVAAVFVVLFRLRWGRRRALLAVQIVPGRQRGHLLPVETLVWTNFESKKPRRAQVLSLVKKKSQ